MSAPARFAHPAFAGRIGAAREEITPPIGIYARSWGAAAHDTMEGVHRPLTATVLTLQAADGGAPLVLAGLDLCVWRLPEDEWRVRGAVIEAISLDPARVMINLGHTHAGPSTCSADRHLPGGEFIAAYLDQLREAVLRAARRALASARPGVLEWTQGRCGLAQDRDLPDPAGGRFVCGYHPLGEPDQTLLVGRATAADGEPLATVVNYACHPVTLAWQNRLLSPDYVGALRETVESHTGGAPCLFLQGASGELSPREQYVGDPAVADAHGREVAFAVLSLREGMLPARTALRYAGVVESGTPLGSWAREPAEPSGELRAAHSEVEVPLKELPSLAELDAALAACSDRVLGERLSRQRRQRQFVGEGSTTRLPVWTWRVGDALFAGHRNEAYSHLQTRLRARFRDHPVVVMNLVNGGTGYLPPGELYDRQLYQVWQTPYGAGSLERLIAECERNLAALL